jgi:hypothetical protein
MIKTRDYRVSLPTWVFVVERVTRIEPASRSWEQLDVDMIEPLSDGFGWPWLAVNDHKGSVALTGDNAGTAL